MQPYRRSLKEADPEVHTLIDQETKRQRASIELIASENYTSPAVLECLGSILTNKYSEGYPGARYYGGNEVIDRVELLAQKRALAAFHLSADEWSVNVQPYSGSPANFAVYTALLKPGDMMMGLDLPDGGHLTHGFKTAKRRVSASAIYFESVAYHVGSDGLIDYDDMEELARVHKPRLIIVGASAYSRDFDYERFRRVADSVGAYLMGDIAHIAGFVATGLMNSPFPWCDVVTTTTHKTLRGPRAGLIFSRAGLAQRIRDAVFPGLQGGPHQNQIAAIATQMREVATPEYRAYMERVRSSAQALAAALTERGLTIVTGGTENHLFLVDLRARGISGADAERALELAGISVNKNTIPGDASALKPSGIRIGTAAITTRGLRVTHMHQIAGFIMSALRLSGDLEALRLLRQDVTTFMWQM
jgi:glycine hydroxymethyltransferase